MIKMAQPAITQFFTSRKRPADDYITSRQKISKVDSDDQCLKPIEKSIQLKSVSQISLKKESSKESLSSLKPSLVQHATPPTQKKSETRISEDVRTSKSVNSNVPSTPPRILPKDKASDLDKIKNKIRKSAKYSQLKESLARFNKCEEQLKAVEKRTSEISKSPNLKTFKSIEFEVCVSPSKVHSPEKPYLSPKKPPSARKNLFDDLTTASASSFYYDPDQTTKSSLRLPLKYKTLHELFRAMDTVVQILYNRKEVVTFKKLKPAVEKMEKRTFLQKHIAQIKSVYPEAYDYVQEKIKVANTPQTEWDLVLKPVINGETMNPQVLLDRRKKLEQRLIDKVKEYHNQFLLSLTPPITISKDNITRWHPEFDIDKVPDVENGELPQPPHVETYKTGKEVLDCARRLFNCNTRMNKALELLAEKQAQSKETNVQPPIPPMIQMKGIPKGLLEKVRQKQAAKALLSMTRTEEKEKELKIYSRLPEIVRIVRNIFVAEKKNVLEQDFVIEKLNNSYRAFLPKSEIENHLQIISKEVPDWLVFHKLRNSVFIKLAKNADVNLVVKKLQDVVRQKSEA